MKKKIHDFEVVDNRALGLDYFAIRLKCPVAFETIEPGQFVEALVSNSATTYLRRPFSIYDVDYEKNEMSLLIKKVGDGTRALADLKKGEILNMVYPLGNTFTIRGEGKALLVGGGVGIAPMFMLARKLSAAGLRPDVLIGGRSAADVLEPEIYAPYAHVHVATDDGSMGEKGTVVQHSVFSENLSAYSAIYACGPDPMMRAVAKGAELQNIPCEVSLENTMACGMGACLCCVVETTEGNKTTCVEGPIFDTRSLTWKTKTH